MARHYSMGESADCSIVYRSGIPTTFVSKFDRVTKPTTNSKKKIGSTLVVYSVFEDCSDCSAANHPTLDESIPVKRDFLAAQSDGLNEEQIEAEEARLAIKRFHSNPKELAIARAHSNLLMTILSPNPTSLQKYA